MCIRDRWNTHCIRKFFACLTGTLRSEMPVIHLAFVSLIFRVRFFNWQNTSWPTVFCNKRIIFWLISAFYGNVDKWIGKNSLDHNLFCMSVWLFYFCKACVLFTYICSNHVHDRKLTFWASNWHFWLFKQVLTNVLGNTHWIRKFFACLTDNLRSEIHAVSYTHLTLPTTPYV